MKDFITLPELLAIGPAHHAVAGLVLPEHLLHGICYLPHGAPEAQTKKHLYYQQAEMKTEHRHHWPNHLPCCWTNLLTLVSLSALQL